jgi:hypothetical protein
MFDIILRKTLENITGIVAMKLDRILGIPLPTYFV